MQECSHASCFPGSGRLSAGFTSCGQARSSIWRQKRRGRQATIRCALSSIAKQGSNPADIARQVNRDIDAALQLIGSRPQVSVKSGNQSTYPVYGEKQKIETRRMRSELVLESRDLAAVSHLIGELQQRRLAVAQCRCLRLKPAAVPKTMRPVDAIKAFQSRAEVIASALGKSWKIKQLTVAQQGGQVPMPVFRAARMMAADAAPAPLEAGESSLTTQVSGRRTDRLTLLTSSQTISLSCARTGTPFRGLVCKCLQGRQQAVDVSRRVGCGERDAQACALRDGWWADGGYPEAFVHQGVGQLQAGFRWGR